MYFKDELNNVISWLISVCKKQKLWWVWRYSDITYKSLVAVTTILMAIFITANSVSKTWNKHTNEKGRRDRHAFLTDSATNIQVHNGKLFASSVSLIHCFYIHKRLIVYILNISSTSYIHTLYKSHNRIKYSPFQIT